MYTDRAWPSIHSAIVGCGDDGDDDKSLCLKEPANVLVKVLVEQPSILPIPANVHR